MIKINRKGQIAIEYILLFAVILIVIAAALAPNGFMTKRINNTLNMSIGGIENMTNGITFNQN